MAAKKVQKNQGGGARPRDSRGWFDRLSSMQKDLVCTAFLLVVVYALFWGVISSNLDLATSGGDTVAHFSWINALDHLRETEGIEPLWVPYIYGGMPVFGSLLFPKMVNYLQIGLTGFGKILFAFSDTHYFLLHVFLSGFFMYLLVRSMKFSHLVALLAGCVFMLNPYAIGLGEAFHWSKLAVFSYIPLLFLLTFRLVEKRDLFTFSLLAATIGTMFLNRHPQMAFYGLLVVGSYFLYEFILTVKKEPARAMTGAALLAGALLLGLAIYSYELFPTKEYAEFSVRGGGGEGVSGGANYDWATGWSLHPLEMINYVIPSFFGFSSQALSEWQGQPMNLPLYWGWMPFTDSPPYIGIVPIVLAIFALTFRRNRVTWFFAIFSVLVFFISFGKTLPLVYDLFYHYFPYFNKFRAPSMILYLIPFTVGILAVYGLSWIIETGQKGGRDTAAAALGKTVKRWIYIVGGMLVAAFIGKQFLFDMFSDSMFMKAGEEQQYNPQVIALFREKRFDLLWRDVIKISVFVLLLFGLILAFLKRRISTTTMSMAIVLLLVIDLAIIDTQFINPRPKTDLEESMKPDATMQFLQSDTTLYRVLALDQTLFRDNTLMSHKIQSVTGYSPAKLRIYQEMIDSTLLHATQPDLPVNMHVVNMLNTKYVLAGGMLPSDRFQQVYSDPTRKLITFRNLTMLPRAWFVDSVVVAESKQVRYAMMNSPDWDPARLAILDDPPAEPVSHPDSASVQIDSYGAHRISMTTSTTSAALLVLGEVYYPAGWKAYVDENETAIYKTNAFIRSVVVPAGAHRVEFVFEPPTYALGSLVTNISWAVVLVLIIVGGVRDPGMRKLMERKKV